MEIHQAVEKTSELAAEALHHKQFLLWGYPFHGETVFVSLGLIIFTLIFALIFHKVLARIPGRLQAAAEGVVDYFANLAQDMGGHRIRKYIPYIMSFFIFIFLSNVLGLLPPVTIAGMVITLPPTRDLNTTLALAVVAFFSFQFIGYRENGIKYLAHYIHPLPALMSIFSKWTYFLVPFFALFFIILNIIEELARVLSLTMRLMGNILGEHIVVGVLLGLVLIAVAMWPPIALLVDILPVMLIFIALLTSVIQAFVFTLLLISYISTALEH